MQFFNSHLFWFIEGIFFCLVMAGFKVWAQDRGIPMPFWKWFLLVAWMLLFGFTLAFIGTSLGEGEAQAAMKGGIMFGIVVIFCGVILWRLVLVGRQTGDGQAPEES